MSRIPARVLVIGLLLGVVAVAGGGVVGGVDAATHDGPHFVEEDITEDTTWNATDGPYRVIRDVTVQEGATLTVEPGTEVQFAEERTLTVRGSLQVDGTAEEPVSIRMTPGASRDAEWETVRYAGGADSTLSLSNATVRDARTGISVASERGEVSIRDSAIERISNHGLAVTDVTSPPAVAIWNTTFGSIGGHGVAATPSSGSLESISLDSSTDEAGEIARQTLRLEPGVEVSFDEFALDYGDHGDLSAVGGGDIARFGVDEDGDGDIERSLDAVLADVSVEDGELSIALEESVRIRADERLVLAIDDLRNPTTRGIYRVDVDATNDGVPQLAEGIHVPLNIGDVSTTYADTDVVESTTVRGLTIRESTFDGIDGAGVRIDADDVSRVWVVDNDVSAAGEGVGIRARSLEWRVGILHNEISAAGDGVAATVRDRVTGLEVRENGISGSESGIAVRQSGPGVPAYLAPTVANNTVENNDEHGLVVRANGGRVVRTDVTDNRIRANDEAGVVLSSSRMRSVSFAGNVIEANGEDGLRLRTAASIQGLSVRNGTIADNAGIGLAVRTGVLVHEMSVDNQTLANNGGAGVMIASPLTHGGQVNVTDSLLAANAYGVHVAGALRANISDNAIVYNTNEHARPERIAEVSPGTAISVSEGSAGVVLHRSAVSESLEELIDDPRVDLQLETVGKGGDLAVVLRSDQAGYAKRGTSTAIPIDSISENLPTGVALSTRTNSGVSITNNDVYGQDRGLLVDIEGLVDTNTTARLLLEGVRTVDAQHTYWGSETGPFHDSILPEGAGDRIVTRSGWVDPVPYATERHLARFERPVAGIDVPETAVPGDSITLDGGISSATNASIETYHFTVDGQARTSRSSRLTATMPNQTLRTGLHVEDELGIDSAEETTATVEPAASTSTPGTPTPTVEPTTTAPTDTPTTEPPTTPGEDTGGLLGTILTVLGGLAITVGAALGGYGMWLTLHQEDPPFDGWVVHAFTAGGVAIWLLEGLLFGNSLILLGVGWGVFWAVLSGAAFVLASR
ncbi:MAG: right-handed parallel beta-helix repeat-containing protein [Halodesulfurarchaeum sp.]